MRRSNQSLEVLVWVLCLHEQHRADWNRGRREGGGHAPQDPRLTLAGRPCCWSVSSRTGLAGAGLLRAHVFWPEVGGNGQQPRRGPLRLPLALPLRCRRRPAAGPLSFQPDAPESRLLLS